MKVVVGGASGLIGSSLVERLVADGHDVVRLVRGTPSAPDEVAWEPQLGARGADEALREVVSGAHAVVNLGGVGVGARRWDDGYKKQILDSRVSTTTCIATAVAEAAVPPRVLVSASASGYYGDTGPDAVDESGPRGTTYLSRVADAWEQAASPARDHGIRVVHPRTGLVADPDGGAFGKLLPVMRLGAGGRLGSGKQWWSPVSITDEVSAICHLIADESLEGPVNVAAPEQCTNGELTEALGRALHRPTIAAVPGFALRAVLGEFADELLIDQRMAPRALLDSGFVFAHPTVQDIVADVVG